MEKKRNWRSYFIEFLSVFIAVIAAFALNKWNDNRRDDRAEEKILREISNGLKADLEDIALNKNAHEQGINACLFFKDIINQKEVSQDSVGKHYFLLTSDNTSIFNNSGYEALKSKGLEIIKNDTIRSQIIALYEKDYQILYKFEETFPATQLFDNYFEPFNEILAENFILDASGSLIQIELPLKHSKKEKNLLLSYLWRIQISRVVRLREYDNTEIKIKTLLEAIHKELLL